MIAMRAPAAFLRTRIARRVFGLFLLCAVLPTATLAAASYWMVTRELREQARTQLAQAAKVSGTLLLARLHEAERALLDVVVARRRDSSFAPGASGPVVEAFGAVAVGIPGGPGRALLGIPKALPAVTAGSAWDHLGQDKTLLMVRADAGSPGVFLVRALEPGAANAPLVWGEVSPGYLWGGDARESLVPAEMDFCAHAAGVDEPLHCSSAEAELRVGAAFDPDGAAAVGGKSDVFLGFEFAAPPWTMRVSQPLAAFSAPIEFRRSVLLTLALGLWLVVLASNVLLRHRLDPVARLQDATRRVAAGDFSAVVDVSTRDELEDLATSFNAMARRLREQFALLGALHEVDREALVGRSDVEVARAALLHFPRLLPTDGAIIAVRVPGDEPDATVVWRAASDGRVEQQHVSLPASSFAQLQEEPDHWLVGPDTPGPAMLRALEPAQGRAHLVLPISERGTCFGAVVLSAPSSAIAGFSEPDVQRARQIADQVALALANSRLVQRLSAMSWGTLEALARSIDAVSPWTAGHSERVTRVSVAIGRRLGLSADLLDQLHRGGLLHDVGKIGVPSTILDKPGKLDDAELHAIRAHPVIGARILEPIHAYEDVIPIVRHHHERFNGTGYPDRLAGRAIPYLARVLSVADVYDALVSRRPYREGWPHEKAKAYIADRAGIEFDPDVVAGFLELVGSPEWPAHAAEYGDAPTPVLTALSQ